MIRKTLILAAGLALALCSGASAAIYDLRTWSDDQGQPKPGVYGIADPATMATFSSVLTPYVSTERPLQGVLAGDDPANPRVTTALHFPDWTTARNVEAQVNGPAVVNAPAAPAEVPLYRVKVVMALTPSTHGGTLEDRVPLFIATLSGQQKVIADRLWNGPTPNLQVSGTFAQGFKAWEGLSDAAWSALIAQAVNMPL